MIVHKYYPDFNYIDFISKYYITPTYKDNEIVNVPFIPNKQQKELIEKFLENDYVVCKKSRQVGGTTLIAAILLTQVLVSNSGEHFYYVGLNKMMCDDMARIISRFIKQLPLKLFNDITKPIIKGNDIHVDLVLFSRKDNTSFNFFQVLPFLEMVAFLNIII